jgi:hypothetical protein
MPLRTFVIFRAVSPVAHPGWLEPDVDFSNYDVPVYQQSSIASKPKSRNRLGEGTNSRDPLPFGANRPGDPGKDAEGGLPEALQNPLQFAPSELCDRLNRYWIASPNFSSKVPDHSLRVVSRVL